MAGAVPRPGPASPRSQPVPLRSTAAAPIGSPAPGHLHAARPLAEPLPRLRFTCAAELAALGAGRPPAASPGSARSAPGPRRPPRRSNPPGRTWRCARRPRRVNRIEPSVAWIRWKEDDNLDCYVCVCVRACACPSSSALQHLLVEKQEKPPGIGIKKKNQKFTWGPWLISSFSFLIVPLSKVRDPNRRQGKVLKDPVILEEPEQDPRADMCGFPAHSWRLGTAAGFLPH